MTVLYAGISERVFEFGFNAEYCSTFSSVLAGCPYIPTQNQEKRLGYDVKMKIKKGSTVSSLYLQHKVSRYVDKRTGSNKKFYDAFAGPYFAFQLDVSQYNLIHKAAQKVGREFYYCAPLFTSRAAMDAHYIGKSVVANSIWIDIAKAGTITDNDAHTMVYDLAVTDALRFSDAPNRGRVLRPSDAEQQGQQQAFNVEFVRSTYIDLFNELKEWWPYRPKTRRKSAEEETRPMPNTLPPFRDIGDLGAGIEYVRQLTAEYYGVSWLLRVSTDE